MSGWAGIRRVAGWTSPGSAGPSASPLDLARERLHTWGARPRRAHTVGGVGASALTGQERRVAVLAARGRTNQEIADTLFITRRTVENHLTSGFRKLGITGRRELAPLLDDEPS